MKIVILCYKDYAGNMYNLATAINKYTKHEAISVNMAPHEYGYPVMMMVAENRSKVQEMVYDADAIVFKEFHFIPAKLDLDMAKLKDKSLAILLGGGGFRHEPYRDANFKVYGAIPDIKWMVTSIDMLEGKPDWIWIPRSVRFDELRGKYDYLKEEPPLVVASPSTGSNAKYKTKNQFLQIVKSLKEQGLAFSYSVVTGKDNDTCLKMKAPASVFFDRLASIYGINSLEAGAFESVVVTGSSSFAVNKLEGLECPFVFVNGVDDATEKIAELIKDEVYMKRKGLECFAFVNRYFSGREGAERLVRAMG